MLSLKPVSILLLHGFPAFPVPPAKQKESLLPRLSAKHCRQTKQVSSLPVPDGHRNGRHYKYYYRYRVRKLFSKKHLKKGFVAFHPHNQSAIHTANADDHANEPHGNSIRPPTVRYTIRYPRRQPRHYPLSAREK